MTLRPGQTLRLARQPTSQPDEITCNYPHLLSQLTPGTTLVFADGTVAARVKDNQGDAVLLEVSIPGEIRSRQGIAAPGLQLRLPAFGDKDLQDLDVAAQRQVDYVGLSFVSSAEDVERLRDALQRRRIHAGIVAKIERASALQHLDDIIRASDAIMIARGDLGVEIELARVPLVQKHIITRCRLLGKPVITATQMLESMRSQSQPTRAEVSDVANAILDGTDAVMLSAETATGQYPVQAVHVMRQIAEATESSLAEMFPEPNTTAFSDLLQATVQSAAWLADHVRAKLVVVATQGGHSALALSKQRLRTPVLGLSDRPETVRKMCLYWGVYPQLLSEPSTPGTFLPLALRWLTERGWAQRGERVLFVLGAHWSGNRCYSLLLYEI